MNDSGGHSDAGETRGTTLSFERLIAELEEVVGDLGADDLELDRALALFERGVRCLREAGRLLDAAEGRVEELIESASGDFEAIGFHVPGQNGEEPSAP